MISTKSIIEPEPSIEYDMSIPMYSTKDERPFGSKRNSMQKLKGLKYQ